MKPTYPIQFIAGPTCGVCYSSQALIGELFPAAPVTRANFSLYYNVSKKNTILIDTAGRFPHASAEESLGYVFNSDASSSWQYRISSFATALPPAVPDGLTATLTREDGAQAVFTATGNVFYEEDFGEGRSYMTLDPETGCWILYDPITQIRRVYNASGQQVAKFSNGIAITTYEYDTKQRLVTIKPPTEKSHNRYYTIDYVAESDGTETHQIYVHDSGQSLLLREYHFSSDQLIDTITVHPQGTDAASEEPYVVTLTYRKQNTWQLASVAAESDGTGVKLSQDYDSSLRGLYTAQDTSGHIALTYSDDYTVQVVVHGGMTQEYVYDASGCITQVREYAGARNLDTPVITSYAYTNNRLTGMTKPDGTQIALAYDDSDSITRGMLLSRTEGERVIQYSYGTLENRIFRHTITRQQSAASPAQTEYLFYSFVYPREQYKSDYGLGLSYRVTPERRVVQYAADIMTGLTVKTIASQHAFLDGEITTANLGKWVQSQLDTQQYTMVQYQFLNGYSKVWCTSRPNAVTSYGTYVNDPDCQLDMITFDVSMRSVEISRVLSATVDDRGNINRFCQLKQYGYDSFGQVVDTHYTEQQLDELSFWQKQVVETADMTYHQSVTYAGNHSDYDESLTKVVLQANGRRDTSVYNADNRVTQFASEDPASVAGDPGGMKRVTSFFYDAANRLGKKVLPTGDVRWTIWDNQDRIAYRINNLGYVTKTVYDRINRYDQVTAYATAIDLTDLDPYNYIPAATADHRINPSDSDQVSYVFYDDRDNEIYTVDAEGYVTENRFDWYDKLVQTIRYKAVITEEQLTKLMQKEDPGLNGPTDETVIGPDTTDAYDVTSHYYDGDQFLVATIDADGWCVEHTRDGMGNTIVTRRCGAAYVGTRPLYAKPAIDPSDSDVYALRYYDLRGRVIASVDGEGYLTEYVYDVASRQTQMTRYATTLDLDTLLADGTHARPDAPAASSEDVVQHHLYDSQDRRIASTDSNQRASWKVFDLMGHLTASAEYDMRQADAITSGDAVRATHQLYNVFGDQLAQTNPWVDPTLLAILADTSLTDAERVQKEGDFWSQQAVRSSFSEAGLLLKTFNTKHPSEALNAGATIRYYDSIDRLVLTVGPEGQITQRWYDSFGNVNQTRRYVATMDTTAADFQSLAGGTITEAVQTLLEGYQGEQDPVITLAFNKGNLQVLRTDGEGYQTRFSYDCYRRCVLTEQSLATHDAFDRQILLSFDGRGHRLSKTIQSADGSVSTVQQWAYDNALGVMTSEVSTLGLVTTHVIDKRGLISHTFDNGPTGASNGVSYTHDVRRRVLLRTNGAGEVITHVYDQTNCSHTATSPGGVVTQTIDSVFGDALSVTKAALYTMRWEHDGAGQVIKVTNAVGAIRTITRGTDGYIIQQTDWVGRINTFQRNESGLLLEKAEDIYGRDLITTYVRDGLGRVISVTNPRAVVTDKSYDKNSRNTQTVLDPGTEAKPGLRKTVDRTFDGMGNCLTKVCSGAADDAQYVEHFAVDALGRVTAKTVDPDALAYATTNVLNASGKVLMTTTAVGGKQYTVYNEYNLTRFVVNPDGLCTEHAYDGLNRQAVVYTYAARLPDEVLGQLSTELSCDAVATLLTPYRGSSTYPVYANEQRSFYNANGDVQYSVSVIRNDPDNAASGTALITESVYDDAQRVTQKTVYATPWSWSAEPDWSTATITAAIAEIADPDQDRSFYYVLDAAGQVRYAVNPVGQVTEKCYRADGTVWLTVSYAALVDDLSQLAGISLADMTTLVSGLANPDLDSQTGSFVDDHGKIIFQFKSYDGSSVSLTRYEYDGCDNLETQTVFSASGDLSSRDAETVLAAFEALVGDPTVDAMSHQLFDAANLVDSATDALGNTEVFERSALGLVLKHTDRRNNTENFVYNAAKQCIQKSSPVITVTTVSKSQSADGNIVLSDATADRAVVDSMTYDGMGNVIESTKDVGYRNVTGKATYDAQGKVISVSQADVPIDDGTTTDPTLSDLPTQSVTITKTTYRNGFGLAALTLRGESKYDACIYNAAKQKRYQLQWHSATDIAVIEYRYNAFGENICVIKYANPLTLSGEWNEAWFISQPIQFLEQLGTVTASSEDQVQYQVFNKAGLPQSQYHGIDLANSDPSSGEFVGLVPYYAADAESAAMGYAQTNRDFFRGKCVQESRLIDLANDQWEHTLYWHTQSGQIAAKATLLGLKYTPASGAGGDTKTLAMAVVRYTYDERGLKTQDTAYSSDKMTYDAMLALLREPLSSLDTYLAGYAGGDDRITQYAYDLRGSEVLSTKKNVMRHQVQDASGTYSLQELTGDLCTATTYGKTGLVDAKSNPYMSSDADGAAGTDPEFTYNTHDARSTLVAQVGTSVGAAGLLPLTAYGIDAMHNAVKETRYEQGADPSTVGVGKTPAPLSPDETKDPVSLTYFDARSLVEIERDPMAWTTFHTYNEAKKEIRRYGGLLQWVLSEDGQTYTRSAVVDQLLRSYGLRGQLISEGVYRDGVATSQQRYLMRDLFGRVVSEGASSDSQVLYNRYDVLGNNRLSNPGGIASVEQVDLMSRSTQRIVSPSSDLSSLVVTDLLKNVYALADLETMAYFPAAGSGKTLKQILPTSEAVVDNLEPLGLQMQLSTQVFAEEYSIGDVTPALIWPKASISNATPIFTLNNTGGAEEIEIEDGGDFWRVDLTKARQAVATGHYSYFISYPIENPIDPQKDTAHQAYLVQGSVDVVTATPAEQDTVVVFVHDNATLCAAGDVSDYDQVTLYDSQGTAVNTVDLTAGPSGMKIADLSTFQSGQYAPALIDSSKVEHKALQAVPVNTLQVPSDNMAWEIPCSGGLVVSGSTGTLSLWSSLPPALRALSLQFECDYTDTSGNAQTLSKTVSPSDQQASIAFDQAVKSVDSVTIGLIIDANNTLMLYQKLVPGTAESLSYVLPDKRYAYMRGSDFSALTADLTIQYADVSLDNKWVLMTGAATPDGVLFDVSDFANGHYPFVKGGEPTDLSGTQYIMSLLRGGFVTASDAPEQTYRDELVQRVRYTTRDMFGNAVSKTNACGSTTTYTYNDLDRPVTQVDPAIQTFDSNYKLTNQQGTSTSYYDPNGRHIGHGYAMGGQEIYVKDSAGNIILIVSATNEVLIQNTLDALSRVSAYKQFGQTTTNTHSLDGELVSQVFPDTNASGEPLEVTQEFCRGSLITTTNGAGHTMRYNGNADWLIGSGKIIAFFDATNQVYTYEWSRELTIKSTRPDGKYQTWTSSTALLAYASVADGYRDLGGVSVTKAHNLMLQLIAQTTDNVTAENRGQFIRIAPMSVDGSTAATASSSYQFTTMDQPNQNLSFIWEAGMLVTLTDGASRTQVEYQYDREGRKVSDTLYRLLEDGSKGSIIHHAMAFYNEKGQKTAVSDSDMSLGFVPNLNGDVVRVMSMQLQDTKSDYYMTYDLARRVVIDKGELQGEKVVLAAAQGIQMGYNSYGQRVSETDYAGNVTTIGYSWDNRVVSMSTSKSRSLRGVWYTPHNMQILLDQVMPTKGARRLPVVRLDQCRFKRASTVLSHALAAADAGIEWVLPIDLGGLRWAALVVSFEEGHDAAPNLYYLDPHGHRVPTPLWQEINRVFPTAQIHISGHTYQTSHYNAGAWVIEMVRSVLHDGCLPPHSLDIKQVKREHLLCLFPDHRQTILAARSSVTESWAFTYDDARYLSQQIHTVSGKATTTNTEYDANGMTLAQTVYSGSTLIQENTYTLNVCGESTHQETVDHASNVTYKLDTDRLYINGSGQIVKISGTASNRAGTTYNVSTVTYDPNGGLNTKTNTADNSTDKQVDITVSLMSPTGTNHGSLTFAQSSSGSDVRQATVLSRVCEAPDNTFEGYYEVDGSDNVTAAMKLHRIGNTGSRESLPAQIEQMMLSFSQLVPTAGLVGNMHKERYQEADNYHKTLVKEGRSRGRKKDRDEYYAQHPFLHLHANFSKTVDPNYVQRVKDAKPWQNPHSIVVSSGDTLEGIAQSYFGDADAAEGLALANGFPVPNPDSLSGRDPFPLYGSPQLDALPEDFLPSLGRLLASSATLPAGLRLSMPSYVSSHDSTSTSMPAAQVEQLITGALSPHFHLAHKHHSFWSKLFQIALRVAIVAAVTWLTGGIGASVFTALGGSGAFAQIAAVVAEAAAAAATDAALQGIAVGLHLLDHFSTDEVWQAAAMGGLRGNATTADILKAGSTGHQVLLAMAVMAQENISVQLAEMMTGSRHQFSFGEVFQAMASFGLNAEINQSAGNSHWFSKDTYYTAFVLDAIKGTGDALIGEATMGRFDPLSEIGAAVAQDAMLRLINASNNKAEQKAVAKQEETGLHRPVSMGVTDEGKATQISKGSMAAHVPGERIIPAAIYRSQALDLSVTNPEVTEAQWVQSVMDYHAQTSWFNRSAAATYLPNTDISYGRFMGAVMTATTPTIGFHQWESGGVGAQGRAYSVWDNIKYGVEAFGDAALDMKPGHEIRAWQASNRAGFSRLMDSYHSWQAQNRANYPNAYHVARAMAQGAAPAAAISGAFMTLVGTGMLVMESGGALSSVAADLLGSTLEGTVGAFSVGGSASISGLSGVVGVGAGDLALRGFANAGDAGVSLSGVRASRMGMFSGSVRETDLASEGYSEFSGAVNYRVSSPLPKTQDGVPIPDSSRPHSQIGERKSRRNGSYRQVVTWGYDHEGYLVPKKIIDFTDHGRPADHPFPHQHRYIPNSTGGSLSRGRAEALSMNDLSESELFLKGEESVEVINLEGGLR